MKFFVADVLYGFSTAAVGAAGASWLWWSHFRHQAKAKTSQEAHHAAEVLVRLQELATRVAFDVEEHSSQVEEINDTLAGTERHEPAKIVDVVAKLIQANERMHEKLATTEDKLRKQAQQIQTHAAAARTDALTLLANRGAFDEELARQAAEFAGHGRMFSLILVDVDHFKKFNDTHGHQAGDEVLQTVAKRLRRKMREMDVVARYGGEEFAVILPGTNLEEAGRAALRACEAIEKSPFRVTGKELQVTASFGVAEVLDGSESGAIITRADKALYAAKTGGRNCVYSHDGENVRRVLTAAKPSLPAATEQSQKPFAAGGQSKDEGTNAAAASGAREAKAGSAHLPDLGDFVDLPSRTAFCQQVRNRTAEWKRGGSTFSVALIEVDQYDQCDGESGQRVREEITKAAAGFLAGTIREMDVAGHYTPGCFALMLPTAGLPDAIRVAERLREEFGQYPSPTRGGQQRLTLSVGVVQVMERDDAVSLFKRAEAALDTADRRGGNRAYYHDGERCAPITAMLETMDYLT